jgi:hypothetical protein
MNETLRTIIELVLLPTSIVAVLAFVMREIFKSFLSMDIEKYKSQLQTDLEEQKARLKAQFDVIQFEFQQRFSSMHTKESEAIVELYSLLAEIYSTYALIMVYFRGGTTAETRAFAVDQNIGPNKQPIGDYIDIAERKCEEFDNYFRRKKIFFDEEVCSKSQEVVDAVASLGFEVSRLLEFRSGNLDLNLVLLAKAEENFRTLHELERVLKAQFRHLLSANPPGFLEKQEQESAGLQTQ